MGANLASGSFASNGTGFRNKSEARRWFADTVEPRLRSSGPSSEIDFDAFCDLFLERHGSTVAPATKSTLTERLASSRQEFGTWTLRELEGVETLPPRLDTALVFPAAEGGYVGLDTWRTREWYPALEAAGIEQRGPYSMRHTFATEALAATISTFELSRLMGTSIAMIHRHYGHLTRDAEESMRIRLDAKSLRSGAYLASEAECSE